MGCLFCVYTVCAQTSTGSTTVTIRTTGAGLHLIKRFETFSAEWYRCPAGAWTIGYGITEDLLPGVDRISLPQGIDRDTADRLLRRALATIFEPAIERLVEVPLQACQFDALVSFTFNVGVGAFRRSTLRERLIARDYAGAEAEFSRWIYAGGRVLKGLVKRREAERRLFAGALESSFAVQAEPLPPRSVERVDVDRPRLDQLRGHIPSMPDST